MRISRIQIENFRNFSSIDFGVGKNAVIVGQNKVGKSNLVFALRLVLDSSLPDSARKLRQSDFWDGLGRPLGNDHLISISVDFADFEEDANQFAILAEHLIASEPMIARLTYVWQPVPNLDGGPRKDSDYEFIIYGGDRPENRISYDLRRRMPMELMPALRDCEGDLARWTRSPLKPLLDRAAGEIDREELGALAETIDAATDRLADLEQVSAIPNAIDEKLVEMVGSTQALDTVLRLSPANPDSLIRALRLYIDGGERSISDASLGSANLLYFTLKALEYEQLIEEGERDHTFMAIEEPEAHLYPNLQRLIFRNYLRPRGALTGGRGPSATVLMTTHSPHIASVTPLKEFVVLRWDEDQQATGAVSTAALELGEEDVADLERYLDVNRGELLFARSVLLVEGDAERFLIPVLAKNNGYDLDELGVFLCSILGTNFYPYMTFLGPFGLNVPVAALTDFDPRAPKDDGTPRYPLSRNRIADTMMKAVLDEETWDGLDVDKLVTMAPAQGIFTNSHTFEVDLFRDGLATEFSKAMNSISPESRKSERMAAWADASIPLDVNSFLADIEAVGKGRFAQRLAGFVSESGTTACSPYILDGVKYLAEQREGD